MKDRYLMTRSVIRAVPRWDAAVEILRKVENSESPWRGEAGRRRAEIQLEHQLFNSD